MSDTNDDGGCGAHGSHKDAQNYSAEDPFLNNGKDCC